MGELEALKIGLKSEAADARLLLTSPMLRPNSHEYYSHKATILEEVLVMIECAIRRAQWRIGNDPFLDIVQSYYSDDDPALG